jgi:predicted amidohydrolase YtcJ
LSASRGEDGGYVLIYGGPVYTMDAQDSKVEAVLIKGNRVAALGTRKQLEAVTPRPAVRLDVHGAAVLPGLIDTHPHLMHWGTLEQSLIDIQDCCNHGEIVARIAARAEREQPGEWLQTTPVGEPHFFHRRSYRNLVEGILPGRSVLDRATMAHPVVIQSWAPVRPSCMAFNSLALKKLGINRDTPERIGNVWIDKDADGEPTGIITGSVNNYYAYDEQGSQIWRRIPFVKFDHLAPGTLKAIRRSQAQGVTAVYENHMMEPMLIDAYRELRRNDALGMRVLVSQEAESYGLPWSEPREMGEFAARLERAAESLDLTDPVFRFNGITMMWDGYCYGGAQMMKTPYLDVYGRTTRGHRHITLEKAEYVMRFCAERGIKLNILAMGTQAHEEVLEMLGRVATQRDIGPLGWVLVHGTTIEREQLERYKSFNFTATTSMTFCWGEGDLIRKSMGSSVLRDLVPLRRYFDCGIPVGGATDWGPKNVWEQIQLSLTHEFGESGYRNLGPDQRITRLEALAMMTRNAAQVMRWHDIGSIAPGQHADLAIVDTDPVECPVEVLGNTKVLRTIFAGRTVYNSGLL